MLAIYIVGKIINGHTLSSHIIFSFHFVNKGAMFNTPETSFPFPLSLVSQLHFTCQKWVF